MSLLLRRFRVYFRLGVALVICPLSEYNNDTEGAI